MVSMNKTISRTPLWAYTNTILLFAPVLLGFGLFGMWFVPKPSFQIPALALLIVYYFVVIQICKWTSGMKSFWGPFRKVQSKWREILKLVLGFSMFGFMAYCGIYITCAAWFTSLTGTEVRKEFTVIAYYDPYKRSCDFELVLDGVAPAFTESFCISRWDNPGSWVKGNKLVLYGQESLLGFRFNKIERQEP